MGATVRNDELQPISDPALTLSLKTQDEQMYILTLSERGAVRLWEVHLIVAASRRRPQRKNADANEPPIVCNFTVGFEGLGRSSCRSAPLLPGPTMP
jgi:hypothetical protein